MTLSHSALAVELRPNPPHEYRVVAGDTLWSIAGRFLKHPWEWPGLWRKNDRIHDPDLIYPGDLLTLSDDPGGPYLTRSTPTELRLSPRIRVTPLSPAIPAIPMRVIEPFLTHPRVVESARLDEMPYVVELAEEHVVGGPGNLAYVRTILEPTPVNFVIFRPGELYRDAESEEILGQEALFVADVTLQQTGDPASVRILRAEKEVRPGDRLLSARAEDLQTQYEPHAPRPGLSGHIIGVVDGVTQISQFSVVALDRGTADRVERGHVFEIWQKGESIRDTVVSRFGETLTGPPQKAGELMVFQTFRRVSFALVMRAERFIHLLDTVRSPS